MMGKLLQGVYEAFEGIKRRLPGKRGAFRGRNQLHDAEFMGTRVKRPDALFPGSRTPTARVFVRIAKDSS